jgi:hypothetical protein
MYESNNCASRYITENSHTQIMYCLSWVLYITCTRKSSIDACIEVQLGLFFLKLEAKDLPHRLIKVKRIAQLINMIKIIKEGRDGDKGGPHMLMIFFRTLAMAAPC